MVKAQESNPIRLRPTTEKSIGTTAFFRNRPLYEVLFSELKTLGKPHYKILFHACSIGAEVYSFVIRYALGGYISDFTIEVYATDLEPGFVEYSRNGQYPSEILGGMNEDERSFFVLTCSDVSVVPDLKQAVTFVDACSYVDFETEHTFDVVLLLNTLIYVREDQQAVAIDKVSKYNESILVTSAFHTNSIECDLKRNGYKPVTKQQREIHDAWTDRRVTETSSELAPGIFANWRLPEFSCYLEHFSFG